MNEEDADLKEVLVRSLNESGVLPKLQAQLKAAVYLALEKQDFGDCIPISTQPIRSLLATEDGLIIASLLTDFMIKTGLDNTLSVMRHEAQMDRDSLFDEDALNTFFALDSLSDNVPVLVRLLAKLKSLKDTKVTEEEYCSSKSGANHKFISSKIPILQNRRASAPISYPSSPAYNGVISQHSKAAIEFAEKPTTKTSPTPDLSETVSSNDRTIESGYPDPSSDALGLGIEANHLGLRNSTTAISNKNVALCKQNDDKSELSKNVISANSDSANSRREQASAEYRDDFDSPRSQSSDTTLSIVSHTRDINHRAETIGIKDGCRKEQTKLNIADGHKKISQLLHFGPTDDIGPFTPTTSPAGHTESHLKTHSNSSSPSIIRVYAPQRKQTPEDELNSDVDDDDDEYIPELLRADDSVAEDTIDHTVDSEQSLGLDYVEDVQPLTKSARPTRTV